MIWRFLHPRVTIEHLGFLPSFLSEDDPRPAKEQIHANYAHGGGWDPFTGFKFDPVNRTIKYPGDPAHRPLAETKLRDETILFYDGAWLLILQPNGSHEIARID